jgi:hypothetical protein
MGLRFSPDCLLNPAPTPLQIFKDASDREPDEMELSFVNATQGISVFLLLTRQTFFSRMRAQLRLRPPFTSPALALFLALFFALFPRFLTLTGTCRVSFRHLHS